MKCNTEIMATTKPNDDMVLKRTIHHDERSKTVVIDEKAQNAVEGGKIKAECPKCHFNEAQTYYLQTRSGDEGSTQFFLCLKCGNKWRDYG